MKMDNQNRKLKFSLSKLWTPLLLVVLFLIFGLQYPTFLSVKNFNNLLVQMAILLIASMGMSMVVLMGSIDVSVGATITITAVASAMVSSALGGASIIVGMIVGALVGLINGLLATFLKIPTFLSTIAMMGILNGTAVLILKGSPYNVHSESFLAVARGSFLGGISNLITIPIIVVLITIIITKKTVLGRMIYAIGNNEYVCQYSGISVVKIQTFVFMIHGSLVGLAGALDASMLEAACPYCGDTYTLPVIAIVVMGGIPLSGGRGGPIGTVLGAMLVTVLISGLNFMGVTPEFRNVAMGALIIAGALMSNVGRPKIITVK